MSKPKSLIVTEDALAQHWGVTTRYVRMMREEDVAVRADGGFDLLESDRRLIAWFRRDEPMQRIRREAIRAQIQHREQKMAIEQRKYLRPEEVRRYIDDAWAALWLAHVQAANAYFRHAEQLLGSDEARQRMFRVDDDIKGELRGAKKHLEEIHGSALAQLECEYRNGILVKKREIQRLCAALGERDCSED